MALYGYQHFTYDMACSLIPLASGIYYFRMPIGFDGVQREVRED
jgi:hypothetical protein